MELLDGRAMAQTILDEVKQGVEALDFQPIFCDVLIGDDPVSRQYVQMKERRAQQAGLLVNSANYEKNITTEDLIKEIQKINKIPNLCGLIVQLPLPEHIDTQAVLNAVDPTVDVDALGAKTSELFYDGKASFIFPTASAVMHMLDSLNQDLSTKKIVMVGHGKLVGKPVAYLLQQRGLGVVVVTRETKNPEKITKESDIIISAVGQENLIRGENVKKGSIIIDAGTSEEDGNVVGDVDRDSVKEIAGLVSPVPGGVGPLTVAMLFKNVLLAAKNKKG